jgi:hypothetical protein
LIWSLEVAGTKAAASRMPPVPPLPCRANDDDDDGGETLNNFFSITALPVRMRSDDNDDNLARDDGDSSNKAFNDTSNCDGDMASFGFISLTMLLLLLTRDDNNDDNCFFGDEAADDGERNIGKSFSSPLAVLPIDAAFSGSLGHSISPMHTNQYQYTLKRRQWYHGKMMVP